MEMPNWRNTKIWRRLAWGAGTVAALWVVSWASFPWAAKYLLQKQGTQLLGRPLSVGKVDFSPWSMELSLHDIALAGAKWVAEPQVTIDRIYIDAELTSLLRWGPVLDAIQIDAPKIRLAQVAPGQLDIQDILDRFPSDPNAPSDGKLPRFALYNIEISDAQLQVHDAVEGTQHTLKDFQLKLPFVSSLPSKRLVKVLPQLSFNLNGSQFATQAQSTPFADNRQTEVSLKIEDLNLKPYLPYLPKGLPVQLKEAVVQGDLHVAFEQTDKPVVRISGQVDAQGLHAQDIQGRDVLRWKALQVTLDDVQPLVQKVKLSRVSLQEPELSLRMDANGQLLPFPATPPSPTPAAKPEPNNLPADGVAATSARAEPGSAVQPQAATTPHADGAAATKSVQHAPAAPSPTNPWQVEVAAWEVQRGRVHWLDETVQPAAKVSVRELQLSGRQLGWPMQHASQFEGRIALEGFEGASHARLAGQGTLQTGQVGVVLDGVPFEVGQAYVSQFLQPTLQARADGVAGLAWDRGQLVAQVPQLAVRSLNLEQSKRSVAAWRNLQVENAQVHLNQRTVQADVIALEGPQIQVSRNAQGQWMYESWLRQAPVKQVVASATKEAEQAPSQWSVKAERLRIRDGVVQLEDAQTPRPVRVGLSDLSLDVQGLNSDMTKGPLEIALRTQMGGLNNQGVVRKNTGTLQFDGSVHVAPKLAVQGKVKAQRLPLHLFDSYADGLVNMRMLTAYAGFDGSVRYSAERAGPHVQVQGDAGLQDVYVRTVYRTGTAEKTTMDAGEDLLRWKQLQLSGLSLHMQPQQPLAVQVQKTALRDFFARVVVQPNGRLNLQDLAQPEQTIAASAHAASDSNTKDTENGSAKAQAATENKAPAEAVVATPDPMAPRITVGPVELHEGVIKFSDFFIQPNYTADLTKLSGSLSAFSSVLQAAGQPPEMAQLLLKGVAQSTASLEISGQLNPLVQPLVLDITGKVRDLELPPLSPYAVKYAGHGIERGKLSVDVRYEVQPNGQLTAHNNLVLQQLTFGDAVKGAPASLPVKLAVALLADSNGVIDIDLPISGSLNDPEFRLGSIILKVIGNVIRKAITAPFSLLAGVFSSDEKGGGDIAFAPGSAVLDEPAKAQLDKIAKSLQSKPALKLTVAGSAAATIDAEGWKAQHLQDQMKAAAKEGADIDDENAQEDLLKAVYRKASIEKPRNLVGLAKSVPPEEMRKLLLEQMQIPPTAMQDLAVARAMAVRTYLGSHGIAAERLFLGDSKADNDAAQAKAQLSLAVQ